MPYGDLRDYIAELQRRGLLHVVDEPVCKDTELVPLVRLPPPPPPSFRIRREFAATKRPAGHAGALAFALSESAAE